MNLLRKIGVLVISTTVAISFTACADKVTISAESNKSGEENLEKKYVIATSTLVAPYTFTNYLGEYVGIDVDLLEAIADKQGFTYELVPMTFNNVLRALDNGEVDGAMAGITITEERKERYDFSAPYLDSGIVMGVSAARADIKSYEDLKNKRVAVVRGTLAEAFAESIQNEYGFTIESFVEFTDVYKDVLNGDSQAFFEDYTVMGYIISLGLEFRVVSDIERKGLVGFAVPKGKNPELLEKFNKGLKEVTENGEYQKIMDAYHIDSQVDFIR